MLLGGADVFHLVHHHAMRGLGLGSNQCVFVLELEGRVDVSRLSRHLARAEALEPRLSSALENRLFRAPRWVPSPAPPPSERVCVMESDLSPIRALPAFFGETRVSEHCSLEVVVLRGKERDSLLLFWFHPFTDAKGALRLVRWLGSASADDLAVLPSSGRARSRPSALESLDFRARLDLARAYNEHILSFAHRPLLSLRGASPNKPLGAMRFERFLLSKTETQALDKRIRSRAKLAESSVFLRSGARVLDRALRRRGFSPPHYLIPVPISLDPKGESPRMFGNHLTMMMFSLDREALADEPTAIASLAEQQRVIVRDKLDLAMAAALEFVSFLPSRLYLGLATLPFQGEFTSLIFSNPGAAGITEFLGLPVLDAYAVPSVVPRPGLEVIVGRHAGRLSVVLGYFEGLLPQEEARGMVEEVRGEMFGESPLHEPKA